MPSFLLNRSSWGKNERTRYGRYLILSEMQPAIWIMAGVVRVYRLNVSL